MFADYMRKVLSSCKMSERDLSPEALHVIVQQYRLRMLPFVAAKALRDSKKPAAAVGDEQTAAHAL